MWLDNILIPYINQNQDVIRFLDSKFWNKLKRNKDKNAELKRSQELEPKNTTTNPKITQARSKVLDFINMVRPIIEKLPDNIPLKNTLLGFIPLCQTFFNSNPIFHGLEEEVQLIFYKKLTDLIDDKIESSLEDDINKHIIKTFANIYNKIASIKLDELSN